MNFPIICPKTVDILNDKDYHYHCKVRNTFSILFPPVQIRNSLITFLIFRKDKGLSFLLEEWQIPSHDLPFFHGNLGIHIVKEMI